MPRITVNLCSTSAVKDDDTYSWYEYTSSHSFPLERRGKPSQLQQGDLFGVRKSSNGKATRLVTKSLGPTIVFSLDEVDLAYLVKRAREAGPKAQAAEDYAAVSKALKDALKTHAPTWTFNLGLVKKFRNISAKLGALSDKEGDWTKPLLKVLPLFEATAEKVPVKSGRDAPAVKVANNILRTSVANLYKYAIVAADPTEAELDLISLRLGDCVDHLEAACAIYAYDGTPASARKIEKLTRLDTGSRDEFSDAAWKWIQNNAR